MISLLSSPVFLPRKRPTLVGTYGINLLPPALKEGNYADYRKHG